MREIASQWSYLVTWLPNRTVRLGDIGAFDGMKVNVDSSLDEKGISFSTDCDENASQLEYASANAVSWGWEAGVELTTGDRGNLEVHFSRERAVLMHLHDAVEHRIASLGNLKQQILEMAERAEWSHGMAVVVSIVRAQSSAIMISSGKTGGVLCEGKVGEALGNLADPRLELRRKSQRSMHTSIVSAGSLTPLYQAMVLRRGLFGSRAVQAALRGAETMDMSDPLREAIDDDFALCAVAASGYPS